LPAGIKCEFYQEDKMKRRIFVTLLVFGMCGAALFAQDFRLSAGVFGGPSYSVAMDSDLKGSAFGIGFGAFFDATYAEVSVGMNIETPYYDGTADDDNVNYLTFGLLGKFPIAIGDAFSIAPAVGAEYQLFLSTGDLTRSDAEDIAKLTDTTVVEQLDNIVLKLGVVVDFSLTEALYLRGQILGLFGLAHKDREPADTTIGGNFNLCIGYRF
jgi:hypothetical protein